MRMGVGVHSGERVRSDIVRLGLGLRAKHAAITPLLLSLALSLAHSVLSV